MAISSSLTNPLAVNPAITGSLAADGRNLSSLKTAVDANDPKAVKEAAKQFESLFMRELLKSMREATMKSGMFDSAGENMSSDLLDQQLSVAMSGQPGGLSDIIAAQLSRQTTRVNGAPVITPTISLGGAAGGGASANVTPTERQQTFVDRLSGAAQQVQRESGIPASFMIGQAGHESGWGKSEIRNADGSSSHNLFGIKAGAGWTGKTTDITTTEYIDGEPRKVTAKFRAYDSYADSLRDYARLINENPRYERARAQTGSVTAYASELQRAGYATDPAYAAKLSRSINAVLQVQRTQA